MQRDVRLILSLICVVSFIYVLRDSETSPGGFLKHQISRILDETVITAKYCEGINLKTTISSNQEKQADSVRTALEKVRKGNPLIKFIEGPQPRSDFAEKYLLPVLAFGAPWIIFFAISILVCLGFIVNWFCMYCACCKCCACCGQPKTRNRSRGYAGASIFFGIATIAVAIAGIILSRGVATGGKQTLCAGVTFIEKLAQGDNANSWLGVKPLADKLYIVLDKFDTTVVNIYGKQPTPTYFTTLYTGSFADTKSTTAKNDINSMYTTYKASTINRADPAYSSSTYVPTYIQNLGPDTTKTTNTGLIEAEILDKNSRLSDAASTIDKNIQILKAAQIAFRDGLAKAEQSAQNTSISMGKLITKIDGFASKGQGAFNAIGGGLLGLFVVEGVLALFAMASICLVCRGARSFNKGIHLSWCIIALLSLLTWILAAVTLPTSLILFEVCDASNLFINNATFFNQTFDKFLPAEVTESASSPISGVTANNLVTTSNTEDDKDSSNKTITKARTVLYNCLFAEQNLLAILNVSDTIGIFNNVMHPMDVVSDLTGTVAVNSVQIPLQQSSVSSYQTGKTPDAVDVTTDLATLNGLTSKISDSCTTVQDTWVLASSLCTADMGTALASGDVETTNVDSKTCIGLDVWKGKDITKRYTSTQFPSTCAAIGGSDRLTYVRTFVNNFVSDRTTATTLFTNLANKLNTISTDNDNFIKSAQSATSSYPGLRSVTTDWYTAISDPEEGVFYNSKCTFVRESIQDLRDTMCTGFIVSLFQSAVAIVIISFMSTLSFLMLFCLAKRFVVPEAGKKGTAKYAYN